MTEIQHLCAVLRSRGAQQRLVDDLEASADVFMARQMMPLSDDDIRALNRAAEARDAIAAHLRATVFLDPKRLARAVYPFLCKEGE